jgi:hypothetical protein
MNVVAHYGIGIGIGIGPLAMGAASVFDKTIAMRRRRTDQLRAAATALQEHYAALGAFVDDPGAPVILSEFLLDFSASIDDEEVAVEAARPKPAGEEPPPLTSRYIDILNTMEKLREHGNNLLELFNLALGAGITAGLLRWDKTSEIYQETMLQLVKHPGRDLAFASNLVRAVNEKTARRTGISNQMAAT